MRPRDHPRSVPSDRQTEVHRYADPCDLADITCLLCLHELGASLARQARQAARDAEHYERLAREAATKAAALRDEALQVTDHIDAVMTARSVASAEPFR